MNPPVELTQSLLRAMPLPEPDGDGGKDSRGSVLIVAGSAETPGAALLAAEAAARAGAGRLKLAVGRSFSTAIGLAMPEALVRGFKDGAGDGVSPEAFDALQRDVRDSDTVLVGPGILDEKAAAALAAKIVNWRPGSAVLDAGALPRLAQFGGRLANLHGRAIITPHAGEMAKLRGMDRKAVEADPATVARDCATEFQVIVVLKCGPTTLIADPDGRSWINRDGPPGLAVSGSGDTLAGAIAGLFARGASPAQAALWGVHIHAEAGRRLGARLGKIGLLAREIPGEFPAILEDLRLSKAR